MQRRMPFTPPGMCPSSSVAKSKKNWIEWRLQGSSQKLMSPPPGVLGWWLSQRNLELSGSVWTLRHLTKVYSTRSTQSPKVDDTLAQLAGATLFSKLDANSGFWQILLAKGRYYFNKLPFGISSARALPKRNGLNLGGVGWCGLPNG